MKKKLSALLIMLATILGTLHAETYSGTCGVDLNWSLNTQDSTLTITGTGGMFPNWYSAPYVPWYNYRSNIKYVVLPDGLTNIANYAFSGYSALTSIEIPNTVTTIGHQTFNNCSSLTSIEIPNSVKTIGMQAFEDCNGLTSVTIGNGVKSIGAQAFRGCSNIASLAIGSSVTSIGESAFRNCNSLTSIDIPNSVTKIGETAFYGCTGLTSVIIPQSVQTLGNSAFSGIDTLISVTINSNAVMSGTYNTSNTIAKYFSSHVLEYIIGDSVTTIGDYTFYNSHMNFITIGNSVTTIGESAFRYCNNLNTVDIPNSVTDIEHLVFSDCLALDSVIIGNGITDLGDYTFNQCTSLTYIDIPNSVTRIGNSTFRNCTSLTSIDIPNGVTSIGNYAFENCTGLTSIELPDSVTNIGEMAFDGCTGLTSIEIPNNVIAFGQYVFNNCPNLTSVIWNAKNSTFTPTWESPFYYIKFQISSFVFGNNVDTIPPYLCQGMIRLTSIEIPQSVSYIGHDAFSFCDSLTEINVSNDNAYYSSIDGVLFNKTQTELMQYPAAKSDTEYIIPSSVGGINVGAFLNSTNLTSIEIPNSVYYISNSAFLNCSNLSVITNHATTPQDIDESVFDGVNKSACTLNVPLASISLYQNAPVWRDFYIEATDDTSAIDELISGSTRGEKILRNGLLLIEKNGKFYNTIGKEL